MKTLSQQDLADILNGACILGAGGGGPLALGQQIIDAIVQSGGAVMLADPAVDIGITDWMAMAAGIGSPDQAGGFDINVPTLAFNMLNELQQKQTGAPFRFVLPGEIGAANTLIPMMVAVQAKLPVLDAAGAPRAMPALQNSTFAVAGIPVSPIIIANDQTQLTLSVDLGTSGDAATADDAIRALIEGDVFTGAAGIALWSMQGSQMQQAAVQHTTSAALELGQVLRAAIASGNDPVAAVMGHLGAALLVQGEITAVDEATAGGFDVGRVVVSGTDPSGSNVDIVIYNVNENLIAWRSGIGVPIAVAPDLVCYLTAQGQPFSNAEVQQYFQQNTQVAVFAMPAPAEYRSAGVIASYTPELTRIGYPGPFMLTTPAAPAGTAAIA